MSGQQIFSFAEANKLLPKLEKMLTAANEEIAAKAEILANAHIYYGQCEKEMNSTDTNQELNGFSSLRQCRLNFQAAIESLSQAKQDYIKAVNYWFDEISDTGVILRDIKSGLLDFPARYDDFDYYLCWQLGENEISHWHMTNDGFNGRKPLVVLNDYL